MNIERKQAVIYPTYTSEVADLRSNADLARGALVIAAWRHLMKFVRNGTARISRVNRISSKSAVVS